MDGNTPATAHVRNLPVELGEEAFASTGAGFRAWCSKVDFKKFDISQLAAPSSATIAYK